MKIVACVYELWSPLFLWAGFCLSLLIDSYCNDGNASYSLFYADYIGGALSYVTGVVVGCGSSSKLRG